MVKRNILSKVELVNRIYERLNGEIPKSTIKAIIPVLFDEIKKAVLEEDKTVIIKSFGSFKKVHRKAHKKYVGFKDKVLKDIPGYDTIKFKPLIAKQQQQEENTEQ